VRKDLKAYGACTAMLLIGAIGFATYNHGGFKSRVELANSVPAGDSPLELYLAKIAHNPKYVEDLDEQRTIAVRAPRCHMNADNQTFDEFRLTIDDCLTSVRSKKNILILGDSHAADLYAGLVATYTEFNFLQATGAGCTPISVLRTSNRCGELLEYALDYVGSHPVDAVIMEAVWPPDFAWMSVEVNRLKGLGVKVILVGPPLTFAAEVPKIIDRRPAGIAFDAYIMSRVDKSKTSLEKEMKDFAQSMGADFIPYIGSYCGTGGCPVLSEAGELLILDQAHLTVPGAVYLSERIQRDRLLEKILDRP
jgi:hypothetical protein